MRKNFGANPYSFPQPVFIIAAWDENGVPCCMNAAWGGISEHREISICMDDGHKTTANILHSKAFTVSMATADRLVACDYVGIVSGNHVPDKFARAGSPYNCAVIALNGKLTITFSRFCRQPELEAVFFAKLDEVLASV